MVVSKVAADCREGGVRGGEGGRLRPIFLLRPPADPADLQAVSMSGRTSQKLARKCHTSCPPRISTEVS